MDNEHFINLSFAVYRVTELFPKKEPLRFKIRKTTNDILVDLLTFQNKESCDVNINSFRKRKIIKDINCLKDYFDLAITKCFVNPRNFSFLSKEYIEIHNELEEEIKREIKEFQLSRINQDIPEIPSIPNIPNIEQSISISLSKRQKDILNTIEQNREVQIKTIQEYFPEISRRSIQRDLSYLISLDLIKRKGEHNNPFYEFKAQEKYIIC